MFLLLYVAIYIVFYGLHQAFYSGKQWLENEELKDRQRLVTSRQLELTPELMWKNPWPIFSPAADVFLNLQQALDVEAPGS